MEFSKLVSEKLEIAQQICLVTLMQQMWWRKTNNPNLVMKLETLKSYLNNNIQPRLAWEVTLFKISMENL